MGNEAKMLIIGWILVIFGGFFGLFMLGFGLYFLYLLGAFTVGIGTSIIVDTFMTYQWPNRHEYWDFWKGYFWTR